MNSDNTLGCKQQSMRDKKVFEALYAECLPHVPSDCLDDTDSSFSNCGKVIMYSGLKMLMDIRYGQSGQSTTASQPLTSVSTQHKNLVLGCVCRIDTD
jgi:hypothetical protein